jgi:hypothetical protein
LNILLLLAVVQVEHVTAVAVVQVVLELRLGLQYRLLLQ